MDRPRQRRPVTAIVQSSAQRQQARRRVWEQRMRQVRDQECALRRQEFVMRMCGLGGLGSGAGAEGVDCSSSTSAPGSGTGAGEAEDWLLAGEAEDVPEDEQQLAERYMESEAAECLGEDAVTALLCPICRTRLVACTRISMHSAAQPRLLVGGKQGTRFSCACGFCLDVPGGPEVDLALLDQCIQRRMREHTRTGCAGEPVFAVKQHGSALVLFMDCWACQRTYPVL